MKKSLIGILSVMILAVNTGCEIAATPAQMVADAANAVDWSTVMTNVISALVFSHIV